MFSRLGDTTCHFYDAAMIFTLRFARKPFDVFDHWPKTAVLYLGG